MNDKYKICFTGVGSIAERHIKNIDSYMKSNGITAEIDVLRSGYGKTLSVELVSLIHNIYYEIDEVDSDYDIVFVTNPTALHASVIKSFYNKTRSFFIEKPVFHSSKIDIEGLLLAQDICCYVACPLRYNRVIQYMKKNIAPADVKNVRVVSSSFLPDWRPNVDYRKTYSAHKALGGGVSIDLIHEWDYIIYLFGKPENVFSIVKKISALEIDSDDIAVYLADYGDKVIELHLDYFTRIPIREIIIIMEEDVIKGDLIRNTIEYQGSGEKIMFDETRNEAYMRELEFFFQIIEGKKENTNDICHAVEVLKIAEGNAV